MATLIKILQNEYRDSLYLLKLSTDASGWPGVMQAVVVSGTENNKRILEQIGLLNREARQACPDDIIVALELEAEAPQETILEKLIIHLNKPKVTRTEIPHFSQLSSALSSLEDARLVLISTPGEYSPNLMEESIKSGQHVFCFSHHISVDDELRIKQLAKDRNLLLMGPDCGSAILDGYGLGFANVVRPGKIGLVSASGSGLQEVTSLVHRSGGGISQAIGVGGRDLIAPVNGLMAHMGVQMLASDPGTEVIIVLAKTSETQGRRRVLQALKESGKPYIVDFLRQDDPALNISIKHVADTFEACAEKAILLTGQKWDLGTSKPDDETFLKQKLKELDKNRRTLWGLFSGGSLAGEARHILEEHEIECCPKFELAQQSHHSGHIVVDLGDEEYTAGRPHPFIDLRWRKLLIRRAFQNPSVGVLLLDVVLGWGCHSDPAGEIAASIMEASRQLGQGPIIIAYVCGTREDPQGFDKQRAKLSEQGVIIAETNARASCMAAYMINQIKAR